jgi:hypothetical protein
MNIGPDVPAEYGRGIVVDYTFRDEDGRLRWGRGLLALQLERDGQTAVFLQLVVHQDEFMDYEGFFERALSSLVLAHATAPEPEKETLAPAVSPTAVAMAPSPTAAPLPTATPQPLPTAAPLPTATPQPSPTVAPQPQPPPTATPRPSPTQAAVTYATWTDEAFGFSLDYPSQWSTSVDENGFFAFAPGRLAFLHATGEDAPGLAVDEYVNLSVIALRDNLRSFQEVSRSSHGDGMILEYTFRDDAGRVMRARGLMTLQGVGEGQTAVVVQMLAFQNEFGEYERFLERAMESLELFQPAPRVAQSPSPTATRVPAPRRTATRGPAPRPTAPSVRTPTPAAVAYARWSSEAHGFSFEYPRDWTISQNGIFTAVAPGGKAILQSFGQDATGLTLDLFADLMVSSFGGVLESFQEVSRSPGEAITELQQIRAVSLGVTILEYTFKSRTNQTFKGIAVMALRREGDSQLGIIIQLAAVEQEFDSYEGILLHAVQSFELQKSLSGLYSGTETGSQGDSARFDLELNDEGGTLTGFLEIFLPHVGSGELTGEANPTSGEDLLFSVPFVYENNSYVCDYKGTFEPDGNTLAGEYLCFDAARTTSVDTGSWTVTRVERFPPPPSGAAPMFMFRSDPQLTAVYEARSAPELRG